MTFNRSKNISLTDMAKWVDSVDMNNCDKDTLVEYLYHLSYHNAQNRSLFNDYEKYDDFAIFCVAKLLTRLNNNKCNHVKSIVNYINNVLSPWHAEYIRCFCCGDPDTTFEAFNLTDFADYLIDTASESDFNTYDIYCSDIRTVMRNHMKRIPRKKGDPEWGNLYLSCLLTLQDRITCAASFVAETPEDEPKVLSRLIRSLKKRPPILFHLDESKATYVSVLVNELIHAISAELTYSTRSYVSPATCLRNLVTAANNEEDD